MGVNAFQAADCFKYASIMINLDFPFLFSLLIAWYPPPVLEVDRNERSNLERHLGWFLCVCSGFRTLDNLPLAESPPRCTVFPSYGDDRCFLNESEFEVVFKLPEGVENVDKVHREVPV